MASVVGPTPPLGARPRRYTPLDDVARLFNSIAGRRDQPSPPGFLRTGPVHFQPLEWELAPIEPFIGGRLLNAGCGNRDIAPFARAHGAADVVNYDIASELPGAIIGPLERMPFGDGEFDTILCNAVLEHVTSVDAVMEQLVRVLRPGGHLIVSIPFLQPFHPVPGDFRRFTKEGIRQLGLDHGLEVVAVHPVHSIAQTLGWITWEYLLEKRSRARRMLLYPILWCFTRYCCRTDHAVTGPVNTFQAVYRKPGTE